MKCILSSLQYLPMHTLKTTIKCWNLTDFFLFNRNYFKSIFSTINIDMHIFSFFLSHVYLYCLYPIFLLCKLKSREHCYIFLTRLNLSQLIFKRIYSILSLDITLTDSKLPILILLQPFLIINYLIIPTFLYLKLICPSASNIIFKVFRCKNGV